MPVVAQSLSDVLLQEVLEHPEDDLPRLVFADWLAENGELVRAEFIQLQCLLAREQPDYALDTGTSPGVYTSSGDPRIRRAYVLFQDMVFSSVVKGTIPLDSWIWNSSIWRRGFVEALSLNCSDFTKLAKLAFKLHPVTRVQLKDKQPGMWTVRSGYWSWRASSSISALLGADYFLPIEIFDLLGPGQLAASSDSWRHFDSKERAVNELSQACVAFGINTRKDGPAEGLLSESEKETS